MKNYEKMEMLKLIENFIRRVEALTKKEMIIIFDGEQIEKTDYDILPEDIISICSTVFDTPYKEVIGISRKHPIIFARHAACYYLKNYTMLTLKEIGKCLGDKDHSTIINSITEWTNMMDSDNKYRMINEEIVYEINKHKVVK